MNGGIPLTAKPRLHHKARLRYDRRTQHVWLLYPERGLEMNRTAAEIARLCTGEHTVDAIIRQLVGNHPDASADAIGKQVVHFLAILACRGLLLD